MNLLHIDSSPSGAASVSRHVTAAVVKQLTAHDGTARVTYRDLADAPPAHLGHALLQVLRPVEGATLPEGVRAEAELTETLLGEFLQADVVVIGAPMYNFSIPSQLKAWIDRIAQAGRTFRYTASGPVGLAGGKRLVIVSSRGGKYAGQAHETAMDHQEAYLKAVFGFLGVTDIRVVRAEGVAMGPDARGQAIGEAEQQIRELAEECETA